MPTLRELKNRLQGVKTTGKLAGAMRTVSTAKYS
ncbi:MAG: F0F1 ATP synthase subunit gamma, partial [Clostridia bacterium]|nr:F0F1 ATP synthase subunit gamma [Clostridia bacterium]